jgi:hypothetical protein
LGSKAFGIFLLFGFGNEASALDTPDALGMVFRFLFGGWWGRIDEYKSALGYDCIDIQKVMLIFKSCVVWVAGVVVALGETDACYRYAG